MEGSSWLSLEGETIGDNRNRRGRMPAPAGDIEPTLDDDTLAHLDTVHPFGFDEGLGDSRRARERAKEEARKTTESNGKPTESVIEIPADAITLGGLETFINSDN